MDREDGIVEVGEYRFENVSSFKYLRTAKSNQNERRLAIVHTIHAGYGVYHRSKGELAEPVKRGCTKQLSDK